MSIFNNDFSSGVNLFSFPHLDRVNHPHFAPLGKQVQTYEEIATPLYGF